MQAMGMNASRLAVPSIPFETLRTNIGVNPVRGVARAWAGGTLFSAAHATVHAPHPVQRSKSITNP
jgi:hypothetical protein